MIESGLIGLGEQILKGQIDASLFSVMSRL